MKTPLKLYSILCAGAMIILGSCELNSPIKTPSLPETISNFKTSEKMQLFRSAFPTYADQLQYDAYWKENLNGEEVFAIPSGDKTKFRGVLYINGASKAAFETQEFDGPSASISIGDLTHSKSFTWLGKRIADHLYSFDVDPRNKIVSATGSREDYSSCVTRVYSTARNACYANDACTTVCDNLPNCRPSMLLAAAWTCL